MNDLKLTDDILFELGFKEEGVRHTLQNPNTNAKIFLRPCNEGGYFWGFYDMDGNSVEYGYCKPLVSVKDLKRFLTMMSLKHMADWERLSKMLIFERASLRDDTHAG